MASRAGKLSWGMRACITHLHALRVMGSQLCKVAPRHDCATQGGAPTELQSSCVPHAIHEPSYTH
jgi:hypothetical protein